MAGSMKTAAMHGAIELELFTAIDEGAAGVAEIAAKCKASEKGIRVLCDYLTVGGFLTKAEGKYGLTRDSAMFLSKRSPAYLGGVTRFFGRAEFRDFFGDMAAVVRKGGCVIAQGSTGDDWDGWVDFAHGMAAMMTPAAHAIAGLVDAKAGAPMRVLDIAAGHGTFGITIARLNPKADIVAVDWAKVLEVAVANAARAGVQGRYSTIAGSAFEVEFGSGYDAVLLTNFFHHFDAPTCEGLIAKVCRALNPGGLAVTLEFVPNEDRVTPPGPAEFALTMLGSTPAGDAYTFAEYDGMFRRNGFAKTEQHMLPSTHSILVSTKA